jgi:hypothetical protein
VVILSFQVCVTDGESDPTARICKVPADPTWADLKSYIPPPQDHKAKAPGVFFSSTPAELIVFDGQPVYATIPGTPMRLQQVVQCQER